MKRNNAILWFLAALVLTVLARAPLALAVTGNGPAANFTLKSTSGENFQLSEYRGQVVLINFWASWCGPCRQEMPHLESIQQKYQDLGFTVFGVNVEQADRVYATKTKHVNNLREEVISVWRILANGLRVMSRHEDGTTQRRLMRSYGYRFRSDEVVEETTDLAPELYGEQISQDDALTSTQADLEDSAQPQQI
jgi:thiol-disulfide isomerase/thioredoxin